MLDVNEQLIYSDKKLKGQSLFVLQKRQRRIFFGTKIETEKDKQAIVSLQG